MKSVKIYTASGCHYCHDAKSFFDENNIGYTEFDISKDREAKKELMKKGYMSVPLIIIDDQEILGFDRERISVLLGI